MRLQSFTDVLGTQGSSLVAAARSGDRRSLRSEPGQRESRDGRGRQLAAASSVVAACAADGSTNLAAALAPSNALYCPHLHLSITPGTNCAIGINGVHHTNPFGGGICAAHLDSHSRSLVAFRCFRTHLSQYAAVYFERFVEGIPAGDLLLAVTCGQVSLSGQRKGQVLGALRSAGYKPNGFYSGAFSFAGAKAGSALLTGAVESSSSCPSFSSAQSQYVCSGCGGAHGFSGSCRVNLGPLSEAACLSACEAQGAGCCESRANGGCNWKPASSSPTVLFSNGHTDTKSVSCVERPTTAATLDLDCFEPALQNGAPGMRSLVPGLNTLENVTSPSNVLAIAAAPLATAGSAWPESGYWLAIGSAHAVLEYDLGGVHVLEEVVLTWEHVATDVLVLASLSASGSADFVQIGRSSADGVNASTTEDVRVDLGGAAARRVRLLLSGAAETTFDGRPVIAVADLALRGCRPFQESTLEYALQARLTSSETLEPRESSLPRACAL